MVTLTNGSGEIQLFHTSSDQIPYFQLHRTLFLVDMSESMVDDLIKELNKADSFPDVEHLSVHLFNIYREKEDWKKGLDKLIEYLIFDNQRFVENHMNILAPDEEFYNIALDCVKRGQRQITKTGMIFPSDGKKTVDFSSPFVEVKGGMIISKDPNEQPLISIRIVQGHTKHFIEIKDIRDKTKDKKNVGTSPSGKKLPKYYFLRQHIEHDLVSFATTRSRTSFYGALSSALREDKGALTIDIWHVIKEEDKFSVVEDKVKEEDDEGSSGGGSGG